MSKKKTNPKDWFKIAEDDLKAASILYDKKEYRQSIFFLQQSNELTLKGLLISLGLIPSAEEPELFKSYRHLLGIDHEAKNYGHIRHDPNSFDILKVFENFYENIGESRKLFPDKRELGLITSKIEQNMDDVRERIKKSKDL